ncbi:MAG: hypothetical protein HQM14_10290 [SAR324 cluster bacterium]|nr:hypothetical protein [SAR324 cluster bacterium]
MKTKTLFLILSSVLLSLVLTIPACSPSVDCQEDAENVECDVTAGGIDKEGLQQGKSGGGGSGGGSSSSTAGSSSSSSTSAAGVSSTEAGTAAGASATGAGGAAGAGIAGVSLGTIGAVGGGVVVVGAAAGGGGGSGGGGSSSGSGDSGTALKGSSGDIRVNLRWSGCQDLDLAVTDPCQNQISFFNTSATCDNREGTLDVDANVSSCSDDPQENIFWATAPSGDYTVGVVNNSGSPEETPFIVTVEKQGVREEFSGKTTDTSITVTSFTLEGEQSTVTTTTTTTTTLVTVSDDHGDTRESATEIQAGSSLSGEMDSADDIDYFQITLSEFGVLTLQTTGSLDTIGSLEDINGTTTDGDDDGGASGNFLISRELSAGTYYIKVTAFSGGTGSYTLQADFNAGATATTTTSTTTTTTTSATTTTINTGIPTIGVSSSTYTFSHILGVTSCNQSIGTLDITNTGTGTLNWSISSTVPSWLVISATSGTAPSQVTLEFNCTETSSVQTTLTITGTDATNSPVQVTITGNIST